MIRSDSRPAAPCSRDLETVEAVRPSRRSRPSTSGRRPWLWTTVCWALLWVALPTSSQESGHAARVESLRAAELAFAASVREGDAEAFAALIDEQAIFVSGGVLRGKAAIVAAWAGFFAANGPRLDWAPEVVEVREDGELGITRGPYTLTPPGPDGAAAAITGTFMSIWQRREDGSWKIVFDSGCP